MLLSIAMIVKNEEKHLEKCLLSLQPLKKELGAEVIIVDTGSVDNTIHIANKYTDKLYEMEWNGNFADMRNKSIEKCSGEWVMVIDGDEVLEDAQNIIQFFKTGQYKRFKSGIIGVKNYQVLSVSNESEDSYMVGYLVRLFEREDKLYSGIIHEQPKVKSPIVQLNTYLKHYGYVSNDAELMEYKFKRNTELLFEDLKKDSENKYTLFQLSNSFGMYGDDEKALYYVRQAYKGIETKDDIERYGYVIQQYARLCLKNQLFTETISACEKVMSYKKEHIDFYYYLGEAYFNLGNKEKAIENYKRYLELRDNYYNYQDIKDITLITYTYGDYDYILSKYALISNQLERHEEVVETIERIKNKKILQTTYKIYIESLVQLNKVEKIYDLYRELKVDSEKEMLAEFIEMTKLKMNDDIKDSLYSFFAKDETSYGLLIRDRMSDDDSLELIVNKLDKIKFNEFYEYKAHLLYKFIKKDFNYLRNIKSNIRLKYLNLINKLYPASVVEFIQICKENIFAVEVNDLLLMKEIMVVLLLNNKLSDDEYMMLFEKYVLNNIAISKYKYNEYILLMENIDLISDEEEKFSILIYEAMKKFKTNKLEYLKLLKSALNTGSHHKRGIEIMKEWANGIYITPEMESLLDKMKKEVEAMVSSGNYKDAELIINQLEDIYGKHEDVKNMRAILCYYQGDSNKCIQYLIEALFLNPDNIDTLINIAIINENNSKISEAKKYYFEALKKCRNEEVKKFLESKVRELL